MQAITGRQAIACLHYNNASLISKVYEDVVSHWKRWKLSLSTIPLSSDATSSIVAGSERRAFWAIFYVGLRFSISSRPKR